MNVFKKITEQNPEIRVTMYGVIVSLIIGISGIIWELYAHFNIDVEFSALVSLNSVDEYQTKATYRIIFINSGNRPIAIQSIWAHQIDKDGKLINSKPDVFKSQVVKAGDMLVKDIVHDLSTPNKRELFSSELRFISTDVNGDIYDVSYHLQSFSVGSHVTKERPLFYSYKINLLNNDIQKLDEK